MNTKLIASVAIFALLTSVIAVTTQSAYADEAKKDEMKAKKDAKAVEMKAKKDAKATELKAKKDAKAAEMKAKKDAKAAEMKAKKDAKATEVKAKVAEKKESVGASNTVTVEMAKGTATNTECGDQCYVPNNAQVAVGGTVLWKNVDSAAHTATDVNGAFDSSLVNAGKSFKHTFDTAGTYEYLCIVHPWMKGTVTVS